jgi:hypothetical protein
MISGGLFPSVDLFYPSQFVILKKDIFMKSIVLFLFTSLQIMVFSQESLKQAGVFRVRLMVDKELTNRVMITAPNQTNNAYSTFRFPSNLKDSITALIFRTVKNQLFQDAEYIYDTKTDGSKRSTWETGTFSGGFPKMSKKRAIYGFEKEIYVKVKIKVQGIKGPSLGTTAVQYTNIHPSVKFKMKAYDVEKKKIYSKKIRLFDFEKISSIQFTNPLLTVTNTNALNADQIYQMIKHTFLVFNEEAERNR